jgi:hypothetical protein
VTKGDERFQQALIKEPPSPFGSVLLVAIIGVSFCCSTANGYDGSLFGTLLASDTFTGYFNIHNEGLFTGIYSMSSLLHGIDPKPNNY